MALAAITHLDQLVRRRYVLRIKLQRRLVRNMALGALPQRSRPPGPRVLPWQCAAHQCIDCQPYVRERYRTLNAAGIDERIRAKPRRVRNDAVGTERWPVRSASRDSSDQYRALP